MMISTANAEVIPIHGHWPNVPLVGTSCEKITHDLPLTEPDGVEYNSIIGLVTFTYEFVDGTVISLTYNILDVVHEEAADYSIKTGTHPLWYTFKYMSLYEMWMDRLGNGDCNDYHLRMP